MYQVTLWETNNHKRVRKVGTFEECIKWMSRYSGKFKELGHQWELTVVPRKPMEPGNMMPLGSVKKSK